MTDNVSFFIPAYNCAETVEAAVDSIMESNFEDGDEVVIVNDASTDDTAEVLKKLQKKYADKKLIVLCNEVNMGAPGTRNKAIEHCRNDLLFCLDADNALEKRSIKPLKAFMRKHKADAAVFGEIRYFLNGTPKEQTTHVWRYKEPLYEAADCLAGLKFPGASGNYLFTKESWHKIRGYLPHLLSSDTWAFGFRQLMSGAKMVVLKDTYYFHRYGTNSNWVRHGGENISVRIFGVLAPYIDQIKDADVRYMTGRGRHCWFERLEERPIRLKTKADFAREKKIAEFKAKAKKNFFKTLAKLTPVKSWRKRLRGFYK